MARDPKDLERLTAELRALSPEDRAKVLSAVAANERPSGPAMDWRLNVLAGGKDWVGGSLRREDMYGDDGR